VLKQKESHCEHTQYAWQSIYQQRKKHLTPTIFR